MSDLIVQKLDEMQALCDAATEGPWAASPGAYGDPSAGPDHIRVMIPPIQGTYEALARLEYSPQGDSDAEFIAASRTDMPLLIAALKAVAEEHYPVGEESDCQCCPQECACGVWEYPCVTVKVLTKALGAES